MVCYFSLCHIVVVTLTQSYFPGKYLGKAHPPSPLPPPPPPPPYLASSLWRSCLCGLSSAVLSCLAWDSSESNTNDFRLENAFSCKYYYKRKYYIKQHSKVLYLPTFVKLQVPQYTLWTIQLVWFYQSLCQDILMLVFPQSDESP